jgi:methylene-fatty-acyl-phospholipid synthase
MAFWANVLKTVQFIAITMCTDWAAVAKTSPQSAVVGILLFAFGQHLNFKVYHLLGVNGVYYGARFGKSISWVYEYPYSVMSDPQYVGCIFSLLGAAALGIPLELIVWWLANYFYLMWLESKVPISNL